MTKLNTIYVRRVSDGKGYTYKELVDLLRTDQSLRFLPRSNDGPGKRTRRKALDLFAEDHGLTKIPAWAWYFAFPGKRTYRTAEWRLVQKIKKALAQLDALELERIDDIGC